MLGRAGMLGFALLVGACRANASAGTEVLVPLESPRPTEVDAAAEPEVRVAQKAQPVG